MGCWRAIGARHRRGCHTCMQHFAHVLEPAMEQTPEQLTAQFSGLAAFVRSVQLVTPQMESQAQQEEAQAQQEEAQAGAQPAILITGLGEQPRNLHTHVRSQHLRSVCCMFTGLHPQHTLV